MAEYKVIDADGHVRESMTGLREFLEPRWQRRNLFPNDAWDRDLRGKLGAKPEGPEDQIAAMDEDGIDVMVLYPPQDCMSAACMSVTLPLPQRGPTTIGCTTSARRIRRGSSSLRCWHLKIRTPPLQS